MPQQILKSWKDIAAYLKVAVSTVQRWERDLGLPVRRAGGKRGSAIMALPNEIDDWLKTHLFVQGSKEPALTNSAARLTRRLREAAGRSHCHRLVVESSFSPARSQPGDRGLSRART